MTVSLGVHIGQQDLAMDDLRSTWRRLDQAGLDWISIWDHFYEAPYRDGTHPHFEALATLATLAADTQNARIGCLVFYIGYRNPALLAKAATTIDHISGGRFELGLGAGWHIWEATAYGYPFPDIGTRLDMLEEGIEIVQSLLRDDRATYSGRHFQLDDATCYPKPVQKKLPIWVGGRGEKRTLEIVARKADGWNAAYASPEDFRHLNEVLNHWCEVDDRDPTEITRGANVAFGLATTEARVEEQRQRLNADWGRGAAAIENGALLCTPDRATERILEYVEAGAQSINVALRAPWDEEALEAYITEVIPAVRKATG